MQIAARVVEIRLVYPIMTGMVVTRTISSIHPGTYITVRVSFEVGTCLFDFMFYVLAMDLTWTFSRKDINIKDTLYESTKISTKIRKKSNARWELAKIAV